MTHYDSLLSHKTEEKVILRENVCKKIKCIEIQRGRKTRSNQWRYHKFFLENTFDLIHSDDAKKVIIWTEENFINRLDKDSRQKLIENFNSEIKSYLDNFDIEEDFFNPEERNIILDFVLSEGNDWQNFWRMLSDLPFKPSKHRWNIDGILKIMTSYSRSLLERWTEI